jgi:7-carboxy-7-deazaguanine synthase
MGDPGQLGRIHHPRQAMTTTLPRQDPARSRSLLVAETFTSFQGEGPSVGQPAAFIRLSRCNLDCHYCDTPYTWDWSRFRPDVEAERRPTDELADWALTERADLIVVTGGEPLLQQAVLLPLVIRFTGAGRRIEIETNGTIPPAPELTGAVTRFKVSPKLSGSGVPDERHLVPAALAAFAATGKAIFKFVTCHQGELDEVAALEVAHGLSPVWVMPEGTSDQAVLGSMRAVAGKALAGGWCLSGRLHVLLWGDVRGR